MGNDNNQNLILEQNNVIENKNINISKNNSANLVKNNCSPEYNEFHKNNPERFPTVFQWDGNGNNVYLTGSFCDWHQFFEMKKLEDPNNKDNIKFFLTLFLPKGIYQYKFKIDDQWKCNSNFPTCSDKNGNINNIVDLTKQKRDDGTTDFSTSHVTSRLELKFEELKNSNYSQLLEKENTSNNNEYLSTNENNEISEDIPVEYNYNDFNFDLLTNQKKIGINNFLGEKERNILSDNYSYKSILPLRNECIDHFFLNKNSIRKIDNKNMVSSCSFRFGFKITTLIYYEPKKI
jgi:hypothetical protein